MACSSPQASQRSENTCIYKCCVGNVIGLDHDPTLERAAKSDGPSTCDQRINEIRLAHLPRVVFQMSTYLMIEIITDIRPLRLDWCGTHGARTRWIRAQ